jgi:glutathione S-transferase
MLAELDLDYETRAILTRTEGMQDPAFRALSGRGKIPLLEDGDLMIGESAAIAIYLADRYRDRAVLAPLAGSNERAVHDELCFFIMTEMDALLYVIRRHEGLSGAAVGGPQELSAGRDLSRRRCTAEDMPRLGRSLCDQATGFTPGLFGGDIYSPGLLESDRDQLHTRGNGRTGARPFIGPSA